MPGALSGDAWDGAGRRGQCWGACEDAVGGDLAGWLRVRFEAGRSDESVWGELRELVVPAPSVFTVRAWRVRRLGLRRWRRG